MADPAPTQNDPTGGGKTDPDGGVNPNPQDPGSTPPTNPTPNGNEIDITKLEGERLSKILENPNLFKLPRIQELLEASKELKTLRDQKTQDEQKSLQEQGKFKELAETRETEINQLKEKLQNNTIDQALTTKLVPEGVVDIEAALKLVDRSKVKIDENGNISGIEEVISSLKNDKAYLFGKTQQPSVGGPTNPGSSPSGPMKFKRSQLADSNFYQEHRKEILEAQRQGLIEDDLSRR